MGNNKRDVYSMISRTVQRGYIGTYTTNNQVTKGRNGSPNQHQKGEQTISASRGGGGLGSGAIGHDQNIK